VGWESALLWGAFGSFAVEGLDLYRALRRYGRLPWDGQIRISWRGYLTAEAVRMLIGAGLAVALSNAGQVSSAIGALAIGAGAPMVIERLAAGPVVEATQIEATQIEATQITLPLASDAALATDNKNLLRIQTEAENG
jgi:hypothetical protein